MSKLYLRSASAASHAQPPHRPRPPVEKPAVPLANALWLRNFNELISRYSEENMSLALDLPLPRVKELAQGLNFSQEIAHHIEQSLRLAPGYLGQVNPRLTDEASALLANPLAYREQLTDQAPSAPASTPAPPAATPSRTAPMPAPAPSRASEPVQILRRANLALVTQPKGAKTVLAELMGVSPAILSHRLHGVKPVRDRDVEAISTLLQLTPGWFDTPHQPSDVPADLEQRLNTALAQHPAKLKAPPRPVVTPSASSPPPKQLTAPSAPAPARALTPPRSIAPLKSAAPLPRAEAPAPLETLSPLADALLKTLSAKAHEGKLPDKTVLKLLETVVDL